AERITLGLRGGLESRLLLGLERGDLLLGDLALGALLAAAGFAVVLGGQLGLQPGLVLEGLGLGPAARAPCAFREQPHRKRPSVMPFCHRARRPLCVVCPCTTRFAPTLSGRPAVLRECRAGACSEAVEIMRCARLSGVWTILLT